jgi:L-rhamnose-H+ transport protein
MTLGLFLAFLSGLCNGLFTAPMKIIPRWRWENIWLIFILTSCVAMPVVVVAATDVDVMQLLSESPLRAVIAALVFGFIWGFGAIMFGLSVDRLGVSLANSMVIGLSSALGSIVPLIVAGAIRLEARQLILFLGVATFLAGVWLCGVAGRIRDGTKDAPAPLAGYLFAIGSGTISAIFNIGYTLALPIADTGERLGYTRFLATNAIWLLMLGAGSIANIVFCVRLVRKNSTAKLFASQQPHRTWGLAVLMGLLWGGSIFLYGAATPLLGDIGPSIGWPLSLAVGLLVANVMGVLLGEWRDVSPAAVSRMRLGIVILLGAIVLCGLSARVGQ